MTAGPTSQSNRTQVREMLRSSDLLRTIPERELDSITPLVRRVRYATNQTIFRKHDEGSSVMFVVSGRVKIVSVSRSGAEVILNIMRPGQVFGEMALLDGKPRSATVNGTEGKLVDHSEGGDPAGLSDADVAIAAPGISMRTALELRHCTGSPVVLVDESGRMVGVVGDVELYGGLLRQADIAATPPTGPDM